VGAIIARGVATAMDRRGRGTRPRGTLPLEGRAAYPY